MQEFKDQVAVITGAASGIGRALAERCMHGGMKVVLADVDVDALIATEAALKATGAPVLTVATDVSKAQDVDALAQRTLAAFGAVHLLCNNAGVWAGISAWDSSLSDWEWVLGANLWGVIHGVHTFVPHCSPKARQGISSDTASMAGSSPGEGRRSTASASTRWWRCRKCSTINSRNEGRTSRSPPPPWRGRHADSRRRAPSSAHLPAGGAIAS